MLRRCLCRENGQWGQGYLGKPKTWVQAVLGTPNGPVLAFFFTPEESRALSLRL